MSFLGYPIAEWSILVGMIISLFSVVGYFFKTMLLKPLNDSIKNLNKTVDNINLDSKISHKEFDRRINLNALEISKLQVKTHEHSKVIKTLQERR